MAQSVTCDYVANVTINETLDAADAPASTSPKIKHDSYDSTQNLTGSTSVAVSKGFSVNPSLSSGTLTLDLTAIDGTTGNEDLTGLKVQVIKFINPAGNSALTIAEGATNGYELLGNAFTFILLAGQEATFYLNEAAPDVGASAKTIDFTGTGSESFQMAIAAG